MTGDHRGAHLVCPNTCMLNANGPHMHASTRTHTHTHARTRSQIVGFMRPAWADRTQVGPMLAPWTLPSLIPPVSDTFSEHPISLARLSSICDDGKSTMGRGHQCGICYLFSMGKCCGSGIVQTWLPDATLAVISGSSGIENKSHAHRYGIWKGFVLLCALLISWLLY